MPEPTKKRMKPFRTPEKFREWLEANHASETELWVKIHKKASGLKTISWNEAVIEALCWGWIDGIKKSFDEKSYLQRFTPRRKGSHWSKRNCEHVENLVRDNRMDEAGLKHVRAAKEDGRWASAYAPPSEMEVPEDFIAAIDASPAAKDFFVTLNKANRYAIAYRLCTARKPETRQRRFDKLLQMLKKGEKIH